MAAQLAGLKGASADLRSNLREFFRNLADEVRLEVPASVMGLSAKDPARCLREDWAAIRDDLGAALAPVSERFSSGIEAIVEALLPIEFAAPELIPNDADSAFAEAATPFLVVLREARRGIAVALWAARHLAGLTERLLLLITSSDGEATSLLAVLSRGKHAAADVEPIVAVREGLKDAALEAAGIKTAAVSLAALEEMHAAPKRLSPSGSTPPPRSSGCSPTSARRPSRTLESSTRTQIPPSHCLDCT